MGLLYIVCLLLFSSLLVTYVVSPAFVLFLKGRKSIISSSFHESQMIFNSGCYRRFSKRVVVLPTSLLEIASKGLPAKTSNDDYAVLTETG